MKFQLTAWAKASKLSVVRGNYLYPPAELEPGVKFFVLMLEQLGCRTCYSCEGHPKGFYVTFDGPYEVAVKIAEAGYLTVELMAAGTFRLSLAGNELAASVEDEESKTRCLRMAAAVWVETFGPLQALQPAKRKKETPCPK